MAKEISIGQVARALGCKVQTIRYYEEIGLVPQPPRSSGNQRLYDAGLVDRLKFILHARELGFPLKGIRDLIGLADNPEQSCEAADGIARAQLEEIDNRIRRLHALREEMVRMLDHCAGGRIADCRVIEVLRDHSLCETSDHAHPEEVAAEGEED